MSLYSSPVTRITQGVHHSRYTPRNPQPCTHDWILQAAYQQAGQEHRLMLEEIGLRALRTVEEVLGSVVFGFRGAGVGVGVGDFG